MKRAPQPRVSLRPWQYAVAGNRSGYSFQQRPNITPQKLRRFSETPIPRRLTNYLRGQISSLKWEIAQSDPTRKLTRDEQRRIRQVTNLLRDPNPDMRWKRFVETITEEMLVVGAAPVEIKTLRPSEASSRTEKAKDRPEHSLWPFDGTSLQAYVDWDGSPSKPRWAQVRPDGTIVDFRNVELAPFYHTPRTSSDFGLSPVEVAINEIEYLLHAEAFASRTASNATPKKLLHFEGATLEEINEIRAWWKSDVEGGGMPITGGPKASTVELGMTTDANLFISWQSHLIALIANSFGVDVQKCNLLVGINRSTSDQLDSVTDEGSVTPTAETIADYINKHVLNALYDLDGIAEFRFIYATSMSDVKAAAVANQVELQDDSILVDEARARMGRGPLVHPITGEEIGKFTLSAYRELLKKPSFLTKGLAGVKEDVERANEATEAKNNAANDPSADDPSGDKALGENSNNTSDDPTQRGGNGVHSAPKPKDKPMNQRNDADLDMT